MSFNLLNPSLGRRPFPQPQPHLNVFSKERIQRFSHNCPPLFHNGCINTAFWTERGDRLFTGSDDKFVKVWDVHAIMNSGNDNATAVQSLKTSHRSNIFCVKTPEKLNSNLVLTCAGDGRLLLNDLTSSKPVEHEKLLLEGSSFLHSFIIDIDQPNVVYSAGNEGIVGRIDLRESNKASIIFLNCESRNSTMDYLPVKALAQSSYLGPNYLFIGGEGFVVGTLDLRSILPIECPPDEIPSKHILNGLGVANRVSFIDRYSPSSTNSRIVYNSKTSQANMFATHFKDIYPSVAYKMSKNVKLNNAVSLRGSLPSQVLDAAFQDVQVSCISFSKDGSRMLVNYQNDNIYQFQLNGLQSTYGDKSIRSSNVYSGHKNRDTFLKTSSYFGQNDEYVVTGCDSGLLWVYDTASGSLSEGIARHHYCEFGGFLQSEVVAIFKADGRTCNGVIPHPHEPMLVSYGIDSDAKIWTAASLSSLKIGERSCESSSPSLSSLSLSSSSTTTTSSSTMSSTSATQLSSSVDIGSGDIARINKYLAYSGGRSHFAKSFMVPLVPELSLDSKNSAPSQLYHRPFANSLLFGSNSSSSSAAASNNNTTCKYKACSVRDHGTGCFFFDCEYHQYGLSVRSIQANKTPLSAWEFAAGEQVRPESSDPLLMAQSIQINQWRQYHKCHASRKDRLPISVVTASDEGNNVANLDDPQLAIYGMLPYYPTAYITSLSKFKMAYVKFKLHEYFESMFSGAVSNKSSPHSNAISSKVIRSISDLESFLLGLYSYSLFDCNDANKFPGSYTTHGFDFIGSSFQTDISCKLIGIDVDYTIQFIKIVGNHYETDLIHRATSSSQVDTRIDVDVEVRGDGGGGQSSMRDSKKDSKKDSTMDSDEDRKACSTQAIPVTANDDNNIPLIREQEQEQEQVIGDDDDDDDDEKNEQEEQEEEEQEPSTEVSFLFSSDDIKALESFYRNKMKRRRENPLIYIPNILNDNHIFIVTQLTSASLKLRKAGNQFLKLKKFENSFRCYQQSLNYCATALILGRSRDECSPVVWDNIKRFYTSSRVSPLGNNDNEDDPDDIIEEEEEGESPQPSSKERFFGFQNYDIHYDVCDFFSQIERRTIIDSSGRSIPNKLVYHNFIDGFGKDYDGNPDCLMAPRGTVFDCRADSIQIGNSLLDISGYSSTSTTTTTSASAPDTISSGPTSSDASTINTNKAVLGENNDNYFQVEENDNRMTSLLSGPVIPLIIDHKDWSDDQEEAESCEGDNDGDDACVPDLVSTSDSESEDNEDPVKHTTTAATTRTNTAAAAAIFYTAASFQKTKEGEQMKETAEQRKRRNRLADKVHELCESMKAREAKEEKQVDRVKEKDDVVEPTLDKTIAPPDESFLVVDSRIPFNVFGLAASLKWMRYLESLQGYNSYSLPLIIGNLAAVALQINDSKLVVVLCEKAIETSKSLKQPPDSKIYYRLGQGYFNLKDYNLSVSAFSQALDIANSDSNVGGATATASTSTNASASIFPAASSAGGGGGGGPPFAFAPSSASKNPQVVAITKALNNAKLKAEEERKRISKKYQKMFES